MFMVPFPEKSFYVTPVVTELVVTLPTFLCVLKPPVGKPTAELIAELTTRRTERQYEPITKLMAPQKRANKFTSRRTSDIELAKSAPKVLTHARSL